MYEKERGRELGKAQEGENRVGENSEKGRGAHAGVAQLQHVAETAEKLQGSAKSSKETNTICAIKHTKKVTKKGDFFFF